MLANGDYVVEVRFVIDVPKVNFIRLLCAVEHTNGQ